MFIPLRYPSRFWASPPKLAVVCTDQGAIAITVRGQPRLGWCAVLIVLTVASAAMGQGVVPVPLAPAANNQLQPLVPAIQNQTNWIESWIFSGQSSASARQRLETTSRQRLGLIEEKCQLTPEQVKKLELAYRGDIVRFFRRIQEITQRVGPERPDRAGLNQLQAEIAPIQQMWNGGLSGPQTLFLTVLRSTLTASQKEALLSERHRISEDHRRYRAMSLVTRLEQSIPMLAHQRTAMVELILAEMPKDRLHPSIESYVAMSAAVNIKPASLDAFLDVAQREAFQAFQKHWSTNLPRLETIRNQRESPRGEEWLDAIQ